MTRHYSDLGSASDWSCRVGNLFQQIRSTTQVWVVTRHQYGISVLVSQTSFGGETTGSVAKSLLFSQARSSGGTKSLAQDPTCNLVSRALHFRFSYIFIEIKSSHYLYECALLIVFRNKNSQKPETNLFNQKF